MTLNEGYNSNAMIQFMRNGFVFYALDGMVSNFCIEKKNFQRGVNKSTREIGWADFRLILFQKSYYCQFFQNLMGIILCWQVFSNFELFLSMRFVP